MVQRHFIPDFRQDDMPIIVWLQATKPACRINILGQVFQRTFAKEMHNSAFELHYYFISCFCNFIYDFKPPPHFQSVPIQRNAGRLYLLSVKKAFCHKPVLVNAFPAQVVFLVLLFPG